jgi:predicted nucleic acid-binding protein
VAQSPFPPGQFTCALAEIAQVLNRPEIKRRYNLTDSEVAETIRLVEADVLVAPLDTVPVEVRDPKDDMVLAAALAGFASYVVTGDNDLLALNGDTRLDPLRIVTPREFLLALAGHPDTTPNPISP